MANEAIPKHKLLSGAGQLKRRARPALSCIETTDYVPFPAEIRDTLMPPPNLMTERRIVRNRFIIEQTASKRQEVERLLGKSYADQEKLLRRLDKSRKATKRAMRLLPIIAGESVPTRHQCRFREITILECLTQVCVDQKEYIPVGNWQASVAEPLTVDPGEQFAFTITDCVNAGNGYTASEGWIAISATLRMTKAVHVNELGVNFAGGASYEIDGEDHYLWPNEWGAISIGSSLEVRSAPPSGTFVNLVGPGSWTSEVIAENDSGNVAPMPFMPVNRSVAVNRNVDIGHTFIVDYVLEWEVTRSDDYWAASCFVLSKFIIKPYIIYKSCHSEYQEINRFLMELPQMISAHQRAKE